MLIELKLLTNLHIKLVVKLAYCVKLSLLSLNSYKCVHAYVCDHYLAEILPQNGWKTGRVLQWHSQSRLKPHELKQLNTDQTGQILFLTELCKLFNIFTSPFLVTLCESSLFTRSVWQLLYRCLESYLFIYFYNYNLIYCILFSYSDCIENTESTRIWSPNIFCQKCSYKNTYFTVFRWKSWKVGWKYE